MYRLPSSPVKRENIPRQEYYKSRRTTRRVTSAIHFGLCRCHTFVLECLRLAIPLFARKIYSLGGVYHLYSDQDSTGLQPRASRNGSTCMRNNILLPPFSAATIPLEKAWTDSSSTSSLLSRKRHINGRLTDPPPYRQTYSLSPPCLVYTSKCGHL